MLLEFRTKNYKSFLDEMVFSMTPAPKKKDLSYSILKNKVGKKTYKGLCSAVIYGPNAAGKTNIIGAIDTLKSIIRRGNINNSDELSSNIASTSLELIPNSNLKKAEPVEFYIKFIHEGMLFEYGLKIYLGKFVVPKEVERKILEESLKVNEKLIFRRTEKQVDLGDNLQPFEAYMPVVKLGHLDIINEFIKSSFNPKDLFLVNGFKTIISKYLAETVIDWFSRKLLTVYDSNRFESGIKVNDASLNIKDKSKKSKQYLAQDLIDEAAKKLGLSSSGIVYKRDNDSEYYEMSSVFENQKVIIPSAVVESMGTIRFLNLLFPILAALKNGETFIVDELDNSLHPMILMNIINIFHNDEINKNNGQLIFNTHNPIFLNANLYRRDEIKFVDRDENSNSIQYSLADISLCDNSVRSGSVYMKNYFVNRYGAIKKFDIAPIFEQLLNIKGLVLEGEVDVREN